jgi:ribosomal protein L40E
MLGNKNPPGPGSSFPESVAYKEIKVPSFCSKCGAAISPGAQSCSSCGTAVIAAAPPAQPTFAPVPPVAAPAKSGSSALKIVLIVVGVLFALGFVVIGAVGYFGYRVAHSIKVSKDGNQVALNVPGGGSFSANSSEKFTAEELGADIYPGATTGKAGARMTTPAGSWISAIYVTPDSKDKVLAFYKDKFGDGASVIDTPDGAIVTLKKGEQEGVVVTITANSSEYSGKTQIAIVHTKTNKAT